MRKTVEKSFQIYLLIVFVGCALFTNYGNLEISGNPDQKVSCSECLNQDSGNSTDHESFTLKFLPLAIFDRKENHNLHKETEIFALSKEEDTGKNFLSFHSSRAPPLV